ncbi:MAG: hypothetical protein EBV49_13905 [Betaproteobacteria bacterium]|nr:hypothetical protein [Betaproteobacteria bacterium]
MPILLFQLEVRFRGRLEIGRFIDWHHGTFSKFREAFQRCGFDHGGDEVGVSGWIETAAQSFVIKVPAEDSQVLSFGLKRFWPEHDFCSPLSLGPNVLK